MSRLVGAIVVGVLALGACSPGTMPGGGHPDHGQPSTGGPDAGYPIGDPSTAGGGGETSFKLFCPPSHLVQDDPIVFPGQAGRAHLHQFFGNRDTNANSTPASLVAGSSTTCNDAADRSAYWVPALYQSGTLVTPHNTQIYYRGGSHRDASKIQPIPAGLRMVIGKATATSPLPTDVVHYACGAEGTEYATPPTCTTLPLWLTVVFPDCWDGHSLDSADHYSHMAYTTRGFCPPSHPVPVPRIELNVIYKVPGGAGVTLASGKPITAHADFMNGWDQTRHSELLRTCINAKLVCKD